MKSILDKLYAWIHNEPEFRYGFVIFAAGIVLGVFNRKVISIPIAVVALLPDIFATFYKPSK